MSNFIIYYTLILAVTITCGTVEAQTGTEHVVLDKNILANATPRQRGPKAKSITPVMFAIPGLLNPTM